MPRLNVATRKRYIILRRRGYTVDAIHKRLVEERIYVNIQSIQRLLAKFKSHHTINDLKRKPRRSLLSPEMLDHVENLLQSNDELTARKLRDNLCTNYGDNNVIPSISTIKRFEFNIMAIKLQNTSIYRYCKQLGWTCTPPHYCQLIREANKAKRKKRCETQIKNEEKFEDVIFSDECTVQLENHSKLCFRKKKSATGLETACKTPC